MPFVAEIQAVEEAVLDQGSTPSIAIRQRTAFGDVRRIHSWNLSADAGNSLAVAEEMLADAHSQPYRIAEGVLITILLVLKAYRSCGFPYRTNRLAKDVTSLQSARIPDSCPQALFEGPNLAGPIRYTRWLRK